MKPPKTSQTYRMSISLADAKNSGNLFGSAGSEATAPGWGNRRQLSRGAAGHRGWGYPPGSSLRQDDRKPRKPTCPDLFEHPLKGNLDFHFWSLQNLSWKKTTFGVIMAWRQQFDLFLAVNAPQSRWFWDTGPIPHLAVAYQALPMARQEPPQKQSWSGSISCGNGLMFGESQLEN